MTAQDGTALARELEALRRRLDEAEQVLRAIRAGEVDSLVVEGPEGPRVYALEGAAQTYRVLIEAMSEGAATLTEAGVISYCNGQFARLLDLPLQRVMGSSIHQRVPERFRPTLDAILEAAERHEGRGELRLLDARGDEVPTYLSANTIRVDGRRVACVVAVDLRPQRRAEELLAAERLASSVIEQAAEATAVCDQEGCIIRASRSAAELSGRNPLLVPFERAFPVVLADPTAAPGGLIWAVLGGERFRAAPGVLRRPDGTEREVLVSAAPLQGHEDQVIGCVVTLVDVTEARRAEAALRESEARFRTLADNIPQLAWMADEEDRWFWLNQRWIDYTGMSARELERSGWQKALHPEHGERVLQKLKQCVAEGRPWEDTFPLRGRDGEYRWFLGRALPIRDASGRIVRWFGTNTDITAQRATEDALRSAVAIRDDFLSVASHELRTPLTALGLQLEGLQRVVGAAGADPRAARKLEAAIRQSDRLEALIDGLLDVSRIASGRFRLQLEAFDLTEVIHETIERAADLAARAGCEVRVFSRGRVEGLWDRSRLDQVVMNLLTNAVKYGAGRPIDVILRSDGEVIELRVKDRGVGIPAADQERIFARFERAVSSRHYGGMGLGLYITREIVRAHGGTISVESAPNRGATFVVRLPRVAREPMEAAGAPHPAGTA